MRSSSALYAPNFYPRPPRGGRPGVVCSSSTLMIFLSTPSARRATSVHAGRHQPGAISIHALREEGDRHGSLWYAGMQQFLSTPSARRATCSGRSQTMKRGISIHALREEGDRLRCRLRRPAQDFYPRPPRGGRRSSVNTESSLPLFLSTPSARRATTGRKARDINKLFLSTPSARRATTSRSSRRRWWSYFYPRPPRGGRRWFPSATTAPSLFLSTPSARRATSSSSTTENRPSISIHALREEGDQCGQLRHQLLQDFYPRPPRGGRQYTRATWPNGNIFLSTPSARRATAARSAGDTIWLFLSTPSARRAT